MCILRPDAPALCIDDATADREPHPQTGASGREKGLEQPRQHVGGMPGPRSSTLISAASALCGRARRTRAAQHAPSRLALRAVEAEPPGVLSFVVDSPHGWRTADGQQGPQRARHLHQVHHPSTRCSRVGAAPVPRRGPAHRRAGPGARQACLPHPEPGCQGGPKRADYVLYAPGDIPIAVIEAKRDTFPIGQGMQQALDYAEMLDAPFAISCNGDGFLIHDRTGATQPVERELGLDAFPSPAELWAIYQRGRASTPSPSATCSPSPTTPTAAASSRATTSESPSIAPSRPLPAASSACCWSWPPAPARPTPPFRSSGGCGRPSAERRILFLADRNILIDQTIQQDFAPFGEVMHKISNREVEEELRDLPVPLPSRHRHGRVEADLPPVPAGFLRSGGHRRMPPRQRRRRLRLARGARLLQQRHPPGPHRHARRRSARPPARPPSTTRSSTSNTSATPSTPTR